MKLLIDNENRGDIAGISAMGQNATVLVGLYNNHGLMDETVNIFNAPKTSGVFKDFRYSVVIIPRYQICQCVNVTS